MVDEKILDKIKKLKALGTSSNENEALRSLEVMKKLMDKHDISEDMLQRFSNDEIKVDTHKWVRPDNRSMKRWEIALASTIARLFNCKIVINSDILYFGKRSRKGVLFIGVGDDKLIASEMFEYVREVVHNEALRHLEIVKKEYDDEMGFTEEDLKHMENNKDKDMINFKSLKRELGFEPRAFVNSFQIGCTDRISIRINKILKNRRENYEHEQNTTALSIINMKLQKVDDYIDNEMNTSKVSVGTMISSAIGHKKGQEVGDNISLDNQITAKSNDLGQRLLK